MSRYIITTHERLPGVRLSKPGHWGNMPHADEVAAREAARLDAGRLPFAVELKKLRGPSHYSVA